MVLLLLRDIFPFKLLPSSSAHYPGIAGLGFQGEAIVQFLYRAGFVRKEQRRCVAPATDTFAVVPAFIRCAISPVQVLFGDMCSQKTPQVASVKHVLPDIPLDVVPSVNWVVA